MRSLSVSLLLVTFLAGCAPPVARQPFTEAEGCFTIDMPENFKQVPVENAPTHCVSYAGGDNRLLCNVLFSDEPLAPQGFDMRTRLKQIILSKMAQFNYKNVTPPNELPGETPAVEVELFAPAEKMYYRARVIYLPGRLYYLTVGSTDAANLRGDDAQSWFDSFKVDEAALKVAREAKLVDAQKEIVNKRLREAEKSERNAKATQELVANAAKERFALRDREQAEQRRMADMAAFLATLRREAAKPPTKDELPKWVEGLADDDPKKRALAFKMVFSCSDVPPAAVVEAFRIIEKPEKLLAELGSPERQADDFAREFVLHGIWQTNWREVAANPLFQPSATLWPKILMGPMHKALGGENSELRTLLWEMILSGRIKDNTSRAIIDDYVSRDRENGPATAFGSLPEKPREKYEKLRELVRANMFRDGAILDRGLKQGDAKIRRSALMLANLVQTEQKGQPPAISATVADCLTDGAADVRGWALTYLNHQKNPTNASLLKLGKSLASDATFAGVRFDGRTAAFGDLGEKLLALQLIQKARAVPAELRETVAAIAEKDPNEANRAAAKLALDARAKSEEAAKGGPIETPADLAKIPGDVKAVYEALRQMRANKQAIPRKTVEAALKDQDPIVRARAVMYWHSFARDSRNHADVAALRAAVSNCQTDDVPAVRGWAMLCTRLYYTYLGTSTFEKLDKALAGDAAFEGLRIENGKAAFKTIKEKELALVMVQQGFANAKRVRDVVAKLAENDPDEEIRTAAKLALEAIGKPVPKLGEKK